MPTLTTSTGVTTIVPENKLRTSLIIQNEDGAINVFLKLEQPGVDDVSSTVHDHRLGPGGIVSLSVNEDGKHAVQGRWTITAASGTPLISFFETESIDRE